MPPKKKILIVPPYGFNNRMANYIEFITARLLAKNNWQVFGLASRENETKSVDSLYGVKIFRYKNLAQGIFFLFKILIISRPAIVHVHNQRNNHLGILTAMLVKLTGKPLVFTEYGLLHDHYLVTDRDNPLNKPLRPGGLVASLKEIFIRSFIDKTAALSANIKNYFFHWALTHADKIVFVSRHNLPLAKELGLKNYLYLPYIFDDARWEIADAEKTPGQNNLLALQKIEQLGDSPLGFFIGQLKLRKGWDIYLKAIALTDKAVMPYFVFITSSAKTPPDVFSKMAADLGVEDRIIYLGKVDGQTLKKIYALSSMVIIPSRYEGFGLAAVEAFESKKPLIASAVPALTETVVDGYNGLLVPPENPGKLAEAISRLARDQELSKKLVAGGQATLNGLKTEDGKNQWLNFYEELIAE